MNGMNKLDLYSCFKKFNYILSHSENVDILMTECNNCKHLADTKLT